MEQDSDKIILKNKRKLERALSVKIIQKDREFILEGTPENEYVARKVIDAVLFGFRIPVALLIKEEDAMFEVLNIKEFTKRKDMETIRARIIGKGGKVLKTLSSLADCNIALKDNSVGIICSPENLQNAQNAIISIIQGSKHANVYSFLEKHHAQPVLDLGLKARKTFK